jgi:hypothetical protein
LIQVNPLICYLNNNKKISSWIFLKSISIFTGHSSCFWTCKVNQITLNQPLHGLNFFPTKKKSAISKYYLYIQEKFDRIPTNNPVTPKQWTLFIYAYKKKVIPAYELLTQSPLITSKIKFIPCMPCVIRNNFGTKIISDCDPIL